MGKVDTLHSEYTAAQGQWSRCRAAAAGQDAVHAAGVALLPKLSEQTQDEYEAYKLRTLYFNATGRTVDGLTGMVFRKIPVFEIPEAVAYLKDDVDAGGMPLLALCEKTVDELEKVGRVGLLVDYPMVKNARTLADERAVGARPYVKVYAAESVINWRVEKIGNAWQLSLVVLAEEHVEADPEGFESKCIQQWRVLRMVEGKYTVEIWRKPDKEKDPVMIGEPVIPTMGIDKPLPFIPFVITGPFGITAQVQKPPILDLVDVNLSHYRTTADYEHGLHFCGLPTPYATGYTPDEKGGKIALGSTSMLAFPDPLAKLGFLEFTGEGLGALSKRLIEKQEMMAVLGARILSGEKRQVESAETASIHRAGESGVLASLAMAAGAALSKALTWCAMWAGSQEPCTVKLNTDYLAAGMTAQDMTALVAAWQAGSVSWETVYDNLQRGEIARQGVDAATERAAIELEGPKLGTMTDPAAAAVGA